MTGGGGGGGQSAGRRAGLSQPCEWEHGHISLLTVTRPAQSHPCGRPSRAGLCTICVFQTNFRLPSPPKCVHNAQHSDLCHYGVFFAIIPEIAPNSLVSDAACASSNACGLENRCSDMEEQFARRLRRTPHPITGAKPFSGGYMISVDDRTLCRVYECSFNLQRLRSMWQSKEQVQRKSL